ncbi:MAG: helix-turn-helix domain-containing protein [Muribaculaceae bacterium]|nr:helix-turn-helix domain-containing protein [Muribaculaceae bacterium]
MASCKGPDNGNHVSIDELNIEEIARIDSVIGSEKGFIASDNLESTVSLNSDYIDSIGEFKVGAPFKIRFTMMLFCVEGEMEVQLNLVSHTLRSGEMLMVIEGTVVVGLRMDPDLRMFIMGYTRSFINSLPPSRLTNKALDHLLDHPVVRLGAKEMEDIYSTYKIISHRLSEDGFELKNELVWAGLQMIGCILTNCLNDSPEVEVPVNRKQLMVRDFIRLVGRYGASQRSIPFYAQKLCVSPKYLGQIVTEITEMTPRNWICRQVVLEAKALLDNPALTVQQVSEALNFANQSFFGTFFRRHTGISPKEYRLRSNI